jgi:hypothetical protein
MKDKRFYLTIPAGKKVFYWSNEKDYQKAINNLIFIE